MLVRLDIQGLALIDQLSIEFDRGFNVMTGETGAGKSIIIKALSFLFGAKTGPEFVRSGREQASVSAFFEAATAHPCWEVLNRLGLEHTDEHILLRRMINTKGRTLAWVNDVPVTLGVLKDLASEMLDVFGQSDQHRLLDPSKHTAYVDQFLSDSRVKENYEQCFAECSRQLQDIESRLARFLEVRKSADYLSFRCEELRKFNPSREDFLEVAAVCQNANTRLQRTQNLQQAQQLLDGGSDLGSVGERLWQCSRLLSACQASEDAKSNQDLESLIHESSQLASQLDDLSFALGRLTQGWDLDQESLEDARQRLSDYYGLFRKMGVDSIEQLIATCQQLEADFTLLQSVTDDLRFALTKLQKQTQSLASLGADLSQHRQLATEQLKSRILKELHELAMPRAQLAVEFFPVQKSVPDLDLQPFGEDLVALWRDACAVLKTHAAFGAERAQLLFTANLGETLHALHKTASGGELSRFMLALKQALVLGSQACILVFDEIDTGISGRVADIVGRKIQGLARYFQVICISHLAQVACYSDAHFLVKKNDKDGRTETTIVRLKKSGSEAEIARLLSGKDITKSSLANAKHLREKARLATE